MLKCLSVGKRKKVMKNLCIKLYMKDTHTGNHNHKEITRSSHTHTCTQSSIDLCMCVIILICMCVSVCYFLYKMIEFSFLLLCGKITRIL